MPARPNLYQLQAAFDDEAAGCTVRQLRGRTRPATVRPGDAGARLEAALLALGMTLTAAAAALQGLPL